MKEFLNINMLEVFGDYRTQRQDLSGLDPLGQAFSADKEWLNMAIQPSTNSGG
jgi:hypothetical protein